MVHMFNKYLSWLLGHILEKVCGMLCRRRLALMMRLGRRYVEGPEEMAVTRLGITYGTLRRLGFNEERVEDCLRSILSVDLDEAYDWVHLHITHIGRILKHILVIYALRRGRVSP
jgi:hypothetical protein